MDKLGPIARSVEDCALVFGAIHGVRRPATPTPWTGRSTGRRQRDLKTLRVGYVEGKNAGDRREELQVLKELGVKLVPIKLPDKLPGRGDAR